MAFEHGLAVLERAVAHLQGTTGDACERLAAANAELEALGESAAVPAGVLTEVADFPAPCQLRSEAPIGARLCSRIRARYELAGAPPGGDR